MDLPGSGVPGSSLQACPQSGRLAIPVDANGAEPLLLSTRHIGRMCRSNHGRTDTHAALPADVDSVVVAVLQHELLVIWRPPQQHPPTAGLAEPFVGARASAA